MASNRRLGGSAARRFAAVLVLLPFVHPLLSAQTIDTILVENANVFDTHGEDGPGFLARLTNALHVRTRAGVIRRTLLVNPGDPYDSARVAESERALRALNVFRQVALDTMRLGGNRLALRVRTADGWSTKPQAGFSSVGGDQTWAIGLVEENFLGSAATLGATYRVTPDRHALDLEHRSPHFIFRRPTLLVRYSDLSDGRRGLWQAGVPFYQTAARWALETEGLAARESVLVFRDGVLWSHPERRVLRVGIRGGIAPQASSRDYVRIWAAAQWRREDFDSLTVRPFPRSRTAAAALGVELGHVKFRVLEHFNSYGRREDADLSQILRLGLWAAPAAWGYTGPHAGVGPELHGQASAAWRRGFASAQIDGNAIFGSGGLDSGRVHGRVTIVTQSLQRQTLVLHAEAAVAARPAPGGEFDPWLDQRGPRLFGAHAFTGTRFTWVVLENRILLRDNVWDLVGVGVAPFLEWGGAWYADEAARLGGDVGLALRLGPTRAVRGEPAEFALGWRFGDGIGGSHWGFTLRKGFRF